MGVHQGTFRRWTALGATAVTALALALVMPTFAPVAAAAAAPDVHLLVTDADAFGGQGAVFDFDTRTGATRGLSAYQDFSDPYGVAVDTNGYPLVADRDAFPGGNGGLIRVDPSTGDQTPITSDRYLANPTGVAVAPDGAIYMVDADARDVEFTGAAGIGAVVRVNPDTGAQTLVSTRGNFVNPVGIAIEPRGSGYDLLVADTAADGGDGGVIRVNPSTGAQTLLASNGDFGDPSGVAVAGNGDVYVVDPDWDRGDGGVIRLPAADIQPGDPVLHPTVAGNEVSGHDEWGNPTGIAISPVDGTIYVADPDATGTNGDHGALFSVDPHLGTVTKLSRLVDPSNPAGQGMFNNPVGLAIAPAAPPVAASTPAGVYAPEVFLPEGQLGNCGHHRYVVPAGVHQLRFTVIGAAGGSGDRGFDYDNASPGAGGFGAMAIGVLNVTPGEALYANAGDNLTGGYSDPINGGPVGGSGGDLSVLTTDTLCGPGVDGYLTTGGLIALAGGGGGGGAGAETFGGTGGNGGTLNGTNGRSGGSGTTSSNTPGRGGGGGTQTAGGAGGPASGIGVNGTAGVALKGSSAPSPFWSSADTFYTGGGSGGGGVYGGGSGGQGKLAGGGGGGGGSSYLTTTNVTGGGILLAPTRLTPPSITLTPVGADSSLSLAAAPSSAGVGDPVVLTATVSPTPAASLTPPNPGTVTFFSNGTVLGSAAVDANTGVATLRVSFPVQGVKSITARYGGNGFLGASSGSSTVIVTGSAPAWVSPTPAPGAIIDATPGVPIRVSVGASDPDSDDAVTLAVGSGPSGADFEKSGTNPASAEFTWTPTQVGQTTVTFTATDGHSDPIERSVTIDARKITPGLSWDTPAAITYGTPLGSAQLDAALTSPAPPHPGTFTYTPAAGTVLHAGDNTLSVTWRPDAQDATSWDSVTATVAVHVNEAAQTLSFDLPVADTIHSYGDAPFSVTAVSTSGLPVTYSVGAGDACTLARQTDGSALITITGVGDCTVSVDQPGDSDHTAAPTLTHSFTVAKLTPTLALTPSDSVYGTPLGAAQLDATISPAGAADRGAITYTVDGAPLPDDGILPAGAHTLTATFTPDPDTGGGYNPVSSSATFTVDRAAQTITFGELPGKTFGDAAFTVSATATSGLTVTFTAETPDVCAVTGDTVSLLHAGACTIAADQVGDANHRPAATVTRGFTVARAGQSISFAAPGDQTYLGAPVALSATGGGSGNPVTFTAAPADVCVVSDANLTLTGAGDCTITAHQAGDGDFLAAGDVHHTITVHPATPIVSWPAPSAISYGTPLGTDQLDATVSPGIAGSFSYTLADGATDAVGAVLHASDSPQTLRVTFTPSAPDDANFTAAAGTTTITVTKADQQITFTDLPTDAAYGDAPFDIAATGGGSGNPVRFSVEHGSTCTIAGSTVTITGAGACVIDADQAGNADYRPAATTTRSLTVAKRAPVISWAAPADIVYGTALGAGQLDASVTPGEAADNGALTYTTDAASSDATGQVLHAGDHTLTATYTPGSGAGTNYTSATTTVTLHVAQAPQMITGFTLPDRTFGESPITLTATGGASGNPVTYAVEAGSACTVAGATLTLTGAGACTVTANQAGTNDYAAAALTGSFTIAKASQTVHFAALPDANVGDRSTTLSATGGGSGNPVTFTAGPAATCSTTSAGTLTITGPGTCVVTANQTGSGNYLDAEPVTRTFAVSYVTSSGSDTTPAKSNGVLPLTITLNDVTGHNLGRSAIVLNATGVDSGPAVAPGNSQPRNNFRYTPAHGGTYRFNLVISDLAPGVHHLTYTVTGDPIRHAIEFLVN